MAKNRVKLQVWKRDMDPSTQGSFPSEFLQYPTPVQRKIIHLGLHCWTILMDEVEAQKELDQAALIRIWKEKGRDDAQKEKDLEIDRINKEHQSQIDRFLREKKFEIEEIQNEKLSLERKNIKIERESEERIQKLVRVHTEKFQLELIKEREHILREAKVQVKEEIACLKEENIRLKSLQDFKSAFEFSQSQYDMKVAEIQHLKKQIEDLTKVKSSYQLGKEGETEIEQLLKMLPDFDIQNVHAEPDKADFRITVQKKFNIILDSKKYSRSVPKIERDKLIDNTDKDAMICAGVLLSLNSKISARQHCEIEMTKNNKPILYLSFVDMTQEAKLHCLDLSVKLLLRLVQTQNEKERGELIEKIRYAFALLEDHKKKLENTKKSLMESVEYLKTGLHDVKQIMEVLTLV
jgi:hypothetical protein